MPKFSGTLPSPLQRKLNLYAGMLEVIDNAFDEIARSVDRYAESLATETGAKLRKEELNSISLATSMRRIFEAKKIDLSAEAIDTEQLLPILRHMEIKNVGSFEELFTDEFVDKVKHFSLADSSRRFVVLAAAYKDFEKFQSISTEKRARRAALPLYYEKYGKEKVDEILKKNASIPLTKEPTPSSSRHS